MNHDTFAKHFSDATEVVIAHTRKFIVESLPDSVLYRVFVNPNAWHSQRPFEVDEEFYPDDMTPTTLFGASAGAVISRLWHDGRVPRFIWIKVESQDDDNTYLTLECCRGFTGTDRICNKCEGYPPFHCTGPGIPPFWDNVEAHGRFSLYWQTQQKA